MSIWGDGSNTKDYLFLADFLDAVQKNPNVMTSIVLPSGEGVSVTVKLK